MARVVVIGDGPGGLSAGLFLGKNGHTADVYGKDATAMHHAYLRNYLGVPDTAGSDFQDSARRQATVAGARIHDAAVTEVAVSGDGVRATLESGEVVEAEFLILSEGKNPELAKSLSLDQGDDGRIIVNSEGLSSNDRVYVIGRSARPSRSQAIISAGDGAKAALDILAREAGKDIQDWDTPPKES